MDAWIIEFDRLKLHRQIVQGKLAIPSNADTKASLQAHLDRIEGKIRKHVHAAMPKPEPWETAKTLKAARKRFGKAWSPDRKEQCRERLADLRYEQECADEGIKPAKWKPLTDEEFATCKAKLSVILAKYRRVPA